MYPFSSFTIVSCNLNDFHMAPIFTKKMRRVPAVRLISCDRRATHRYGRLGWAPKSRSAFGTWRKPHTWDGMVRWGWEVAPHLRYWLLE